MNASAAAMPQRRGTCPGLSTPMPSGDGLLARLLPIGTMPLSTFSACCAAARRHGNGIVEVTSRGSIQVRGLSDSSTPRFAAEIAALGIVAEDGVPIHCNPLAGIGTGEVFDSASLADELRRALRHRSFGAAINAKVSIAIDGGGQPDIAELPADIRLSAQAIRGDILLHVSIGGDHRSATALGAVTPNNGVEAVLRLLMMIAASGRDVRARDILAAEGRTALRATIGTVFVPASPVSPLHRSADIIAAHPLRDGLLARGVGLAFGHADATSLQRLADAAAAAGALGVRAAPGRTLLLTGIKPDAADAFAACAEELGFIVRAEDPRRRIVACAGAPICAAAHIEARSLAPRIAAAIAPSDAGMATIHISGCAKGCAHARRAALTVTGTADGCALIANGVARDAPFATVPAHDLPGAVARLARAREGETIHV